MALYICEFIPKKAALSNGTVALTIAVEAKIKAGRDESLSL